MWGSAVKSRTFSGWEQAWNSEPLISACDDGGRTTCAPGTNAIRMSGPTPWAMPCWAAAEGPEEPEISHVSVLSPWLSCSLLGHLGPDPEILRKEED